MYKRFVKAERIGPFALLALFALGIFVFFFSARIYIYLVLNAIILRDFKHEQTYYITEATRISMVCLKFFDNYLHIFILNTV